MNEDPSVERVVTVLSNCSSQLRRAHSDLSQTTASVDALTKISGVADALDTLSSHVSQVLLDAQQARRTAGGLTTEVSRLRSMNRALSSRAIEHL